MIIFKSAELILISFFFVSLPVQSIPSNGYQKFFDILGTMHFKNDARQLIYSQDMAIEKEKYRAKKAVNLASQKKLATDQAENAQLADTNEKLTEQIRKGYDQSFARQRFTISLAVSSLVGGVIGGICYAFGLRLPTTISAHKWMSLGTLATFAATSLLSYGIGRYCGTKAQPYLERGELRKAIKSGDMESFAMLEMLGFAKPTLGNRIALARAIKTGFQG